jgi:hypothetical protein
MTRPQKVLPLLCAAGLRGQVHDSLSPPRP